MTVTLIDPNRPKDVIIKKLTILYNNTSQIILLISYYMTNIQTSLLDTITECSKEKLTANDLMQLPFIQEISNNNFTLSDKTLDQLIQSLVTYSYLNIDSKLVVSEILWLLGGNRD